MTPAAAMPTPSSPATMPQSGSRSTPAQTRNPLTRASRPTRAHNTPAWRGPAYIVFYDLQLANENSTARGAGQSRGTCPATSVAVANAVTMPSSIAWEIWHPRPLRSSRWWMDRQPARVTVGRRMVIDVVVALRDQLGPIRHRLWGGQVCRDPKLFNSLISSDDGLSFP